MITTCEYCLHFWEGKSLRNPDDKSTSIVRECKKEGPVLSTDKICKDFSLNKFISCRINSIRLDVEVCLARYEKMLKLDPLFQDCSKCRQILTILNCIK